MIDLWYKLPKNPNRKFKTRSISKIDTVVVHATCAENWSPQKLNALCTGADATPDDFTDDLKVMRNEPTCSYHDYIRSDGEVYHMVDYHIRTWHAGNWNTKSIGIALEYNPKSEMKPSQPMMTSLYNHIAIMSYMFGIENIRGHRELEGTGWYIKNGQYVQRKTCPGMLIDMDRVRVFCKEAEDSFNLTIKERY